MADVAHDASGPASSEPAGIALPQAGGPASCDRGKLRVFISYSRDDLKFADQLDAALNAYGFECLIDRHGISGGEDWKRRLGNLISEADTIVFVLSPSSARSEICDWEVEEAARLNKRILPVNCRPLEGASPPPPRLRELNYIFFYEQPKVTSSGFGTGLAKLITALNTDFDWLRAHTRYLQRAIEWDTGGRPTNRLLYGSDVPEATTWAARRPKSAPEPTALHLDFIRASEEEAEARLSEQRKQLEAMAAAQAEREKALHDAEEALKQAADAQRRRTRIRNLALVAVSILAVLAMLLGWFAERQRIAAEQQREIAEIQKETAEEQRQQADDLLKRATNIIAEKKIWQQMDDETRSEAFAVFQTGAIHGDATSMYDLGVFYQNGYGVPRDFAKAREWYEKAAAKDSSLAMANLGALFVNGLGVPQDYTKAREWYEKAADKGNASAKMALERLPMREAEMAGRYDEALRLAEAFAAKFEAEETKRDGRPGEQTAGELQQMTWYALFAKDYTKALAVADHAHTLFPDNLGVETNRAHALMFTGHDEEAKALYVAHKGEVREPSGKLWEQVIAQDFAAFRKAGLTHPMMADIEKELGISR
jgi:TPR repeat protein